MIFGIGIDATKLSRFKKFIHNQRFINRILTNQEQEDFNNTDESKKANFLAKRFSGKEAFAKAFSTGIGGDFSFKSISIIKTTNNAPKIVLLDDDLKVKLANCFISFTDEKLEKDTLISSFVILEK